MIKFDAVIIQRILHNWNEYKILVVSLEQNDNYENLQAAAWKEIKFIHDGFG
jgi:hypothetical protein